MVKRQIAVVTGTRADYGILYWLLKEIQQRPMLELQLLVTGMHLSPEFGLTYRQIETDGFPIHDKIEILLSSDTPVSISTSIALGITGFAKAFERSRPDILALMGDRFESLAAGTAAMVARIPIAHISGGKSTEGVIDDAIRHALTKMSHFHFTHTSEHKARIIRMGEEPDRVYDFGAPLVDGIVRLPEMPRAVLTERLGVSLEDSYLLVVFHPVTLEHNSAGWQMEELLAALDILGQQVIFIMPNADPGGRVIFQKIEEYITRNPKALRFISLERPLYLHLLRHAAAIVGNSSSGITEAPSLGVPAVNIGDRQRGILKGKNVIDCAANRESIVAATKRALDPLFRHSLRGIGSPYGKGDACKQIVDVLEEVQLGEALLKKRFYSCDMPAERASRQAQIVETEMNKSI